MITDEVNGDTNLVIIECIDLPLGLKATVDFVDALDSKRNDLKAEIAILCSNTGFEKITMRKGKRKNIHLISALKADEPNAKAVIKEIVYPCVIKFEGMDFTYKWAKKFGNILEADSFDSKSITFLENPVIDWILQQAGYHLYQNPNNKSLEISNVFEPPIEVRHGQDILLAKEIQIIVRYSTEWYSQKMTIDASLGFYDYLKKRIYLGAEATQSMSVDLNRDLWEPIDFIPTSEDLVVVDRNNYVELYIIDGIPPFEPNKLPELNSLAIHNCNVPNHDEEFKERSERMLMHKAREKRIQ